MTAESKPRLAVDIGGTFTDLVLRSSDGTVTTAKVPTTPANITEGILEGVAKVRSSSVCSRGVRSWNDDCAQCSSRA